MRGFAGGITVCYKPAQLPSKDSVKVILKPSRLTSGEQGSKAPFSSTVLEKSLCCLHYNNTQRFHNCRSTLLLQYMRLSVCILFIFF